MDKHRHSVFYRNHAAILLQNRRSLCYTHAFIMLQKHLALTNLETQAFIILQNRKHAVIILQNRRSFIDNTCSHQFTEQRSHYFTKTDSGALQDIVNKPGPIVILHGNSIITSNMTETLPISIHLSKAGQETYVFNKLKNKSSLSLGQLCDNNCSH